MMRSALACIASTACVLVVACGSSDNDFAFYKPDPTTGVGGTSASDGSIPDTSTAYGGSSGSAMGGSAGAGGTAVDGSDDGQSDGGEEADVVEDTWDGSVACQDDPETVSNDTLAEESDLGEFDDCLNYQGVPVYGVLRDASDVDWFRFRGVDGYNPLCGIEAMVKLESTVEMQLCAFVEREAGVPTDVTCSAGELTEAEGFPGCCMTGTAVEFDVQYDKLTALPQDTAKVHIRVSGLGEGMTCAAYNMNFKF